MSRVLQVLEIFEIWICQILKFCWLPKVTSNLSKQPTERDGGGDNNEAYVKIFENFYVIVTNRRMIDGFRW